MTFAYVPHKEYQAYNELMSTNHSNLGKASIMMAVEVLRFSLSSPHMLLSYLMQGETLCHVIESLGIRYLAKICTSSQQMLLD